MCVPEGRHCRILNLRITNNQLLKNTNTFECGALQVRGSEKCKGSEFISLNIVCIIEHTVIKGTII